MGTEEEEEEVVEEVLDGLSYVSALPTSRSHRRARYSFMNRSGVP